MRPAVSNPPLPPPAVVQVFQSLVDALGRLRRRIMPPPVVVIEDAVMNLVVGRCLFVAAELDVATLLRDGPRAVDDLARETGAHPDALYRVLRALSAVGYFEERAGRHFATTRLSECLRGDAPGSMRASVRYAGADWLMGSWGDMLTTLRTGRTYAENAHGTGFFASFDHEPARRVTFDAAMTSMSAMAVPAIAAVCDLAEVRSIADLGGGEGGLLAALLQKAPAARGTLFDLPAVIAREPRGALCEADVAARVTRVAGDFFAAVPEGHDLYVLKWILHDWRDADAGRILRAVRAAMPVRGRLLVVEMLVGAPNRFSPAAIADVGMLNLTGGRERTAEEFRALLEGSGFSLRRALPTAAGYTVLEAVPR